jgi:dTDP-D-glucose 4,6-dehydratase
VLDWEPTTSFEDGMRRYVDWYLAETEVAGAQVSEA